MKTLTATLYNHQEAINNRDLNDEIHKGFTVGKGKIMYFMIIWRSSGNCTVYPKDAVNHWPRNLTGFETITIHFKESLNKD